MEIYFRGIGDHLKGISYPSGPPDAKHRSQPWFWVVHPARNADAFFQDQVYGEAAEKCIELGGGILFLKGVGFAGMGSEAKATEFERKHQSRVHCLRTACSGNSPKIVERVRRFLLNIEQAEPGQPFAWDEVEPLGWPESTIAIYLLLKAIETCKQYEEKIRRAWTELDPSWREKLWLDAWEEYHQEDDANPQAWIGAELPTPEAPSVDLPVSSKVPKAIELLRLSLSRNP